MAEFDGFVRILMIEGHPDRGRVCRVKNREDHSGRLEVVLADGEKEIYTPSFLDKPGVKSTRLCNAYRILEDVEGSMLDVEQREKGPLGPKTFIRDVLGLGRYSGAIAVFKDIEVIFGYNPFRITEEQTK